MLKPINLYNIENLRYMAAHERPLDLAHAFAILYAHNPDTFARLVNDVAKHQNPVSFVEAIKFIDEQRDKIKSEARQYGEQGVILERQMHKYYMEIIAAHSQPDVCVRALFYLHENKIDTGENSDFTILVSGFSSNAVVIISLLHKMNLLESVVKNKQAAAIFSVLQVLDSVKPGLISAANVEMLLDKRNYALLANDFYEGYWKPRNGDINQQAFNSIVAIMKEKQGEKTRSHSSQMRFPWQTDALSHDAGEPDLSGVRSKRSGKK